MAALILKRTTGRAHTADLLSSDTASVPGKLVISGTLLSGSEVLRIQGETLLEGTLHGTLNGTGFTIGVAGASANTGSALQIGSFTTTQRGNLASSTGAAGMVIYNSTLGIFQLSNSLRWGDVASNNFQATVDPTTANDSTQGYLAGSLWLNTTSKVMWACVDATGANAVWIPSTNDGQSQTNQNIVAGQHFLFNLADYTNTGKVVANEVQYTKIFLVAGTVLTKAQVFIDHGATGNINLGLYDQATPSSNSGTPRNRVASTGSTSLSAGDNGTYKLINLSSSYSVPNTGYYWIAMIGDSVVPRYASTAQFLAGFAPINFQSSSGVVLPATASSLLTATPTGILYVALTE